MTEQISYIPARLKNAAVNGHVAGAEDIIDDVLNRTQNDINEEVAAVPYNVSSPNGMGKVVLKKNDNFKQVIEAQTNGNTIFVIKYDFTLTDDVTIPANCVLEFDGGSINLNTYTVSGNIKNDFIDVSNFTIDNDITNALKVCLTISDKVYIPSGTFVINKSITIPGNKKIFGYSNKQTVILIANNAKLYFNESNDCTLTDLVFVGAANKIDEILLIDDCKRSLIERITISGANNMIGIAIKNVDASTTSGNSFITIKDTTIWNAKIGLEIDTTLGDAYVTSCIFQNIYITQFSDTGLVIRGNQVFANTFNEIIIQDAGNVGSVHKGIDFDGGYMNTFNNLVVWYDGKQYEHDFYAIYLTSDCEDKTNITGYIEGRLGPNFGSSTFNIFLSRFNYDINGSLFNENKINIYNGKISNNNISYYNITKLFSLSEPNENVEFTPVGNVTEIKKYADCIEVISSAAGQIGVDIKLNNIIPSGTKVKLLTRTFAQSSYSITAVYDDTGTDLESAYIDNTSVIVPSNTKNGLSTDSSYLNIRLVGNNTTSFKIYEAYLVTYTDYYVPWMIFTNRSNLFQCLCKSPTNNTFNV